MLVATVEADTIAKCKEKLDKIQNHIDVYELRIDTLSQWKLSDIQKLRSAYLLPVIFTLRPISQKGHYTKSIEQRIKDIEKLLSLEPDFFDIEIEVAEEIIQKWQKKYPKVCFILSYHGENVVAIEELLLQMLQRKADVYKIAIKPSSFAQLSLFFHLMQKYAKKYSIIAIALGEKFTFTRLLGKHIPNYFHYVGVDTPSAKGQLLLEEAINIYGIQQIDRKTKFFALIGDPIDKSQSHLYHNQMFQKQKLHCTYVKIPLQQEELSSFFAFIANYPFIGCSVTMPLKEKIIPFVSEREDNFPSINTLVKREHQWIGYNTDAIAAKELLKEKIDLQGKKIAILGGGGSAKAIAYTLCKEPVNICFFTRSLEKISSFAEKISSRALLLKDLLEKSFDIIINTIPIEDTLVFPSIVLKKSRVVMDIVRPKYTQTTALIKKASEIGCITIDGFSFFIKQAEYQRKIWQGAALL